MGPAFETFVGVAIIVLLAVAVAAFILRKPITNLYNRLCTEDRREMAEALAREQACEAERQARIKAEQELGRDCDHVEIDSAAGAGKSIPTVEPVETIEAKEP